MWGEATEQVVCTKHKGVPSGPCLSDFKLPHTSIHPQVKPYHSVVIIFFYLFDVCVTLHYDFMRILIFLMSAKFPSVFMEAILTFVTYFCEILNLKTTFNLPNKEANEAVVAEKRLFSTDVTSGMNTVSCFGIRNFIKFHKSQKFRLAYQT